MIGGSIAIDLGSTTTVVAHQAPGEPARLLPLPPLSLSDPEVVPTLLWLQHPGDRQPLVGRQVLEAGLADADHPQLHRDFKRQIGAEPGVTPRTEGERLSAEQAGSLLLRRLWQALPAELAPDRLVLTAPIETYRGYRQWLLEACEHLAVPEVALLDEPTAAAIGAGLPAGSTVLVVDLGGGTLDLSLVQLQGGEGRAAPIAQLLRFAGRTLENSRQQLRCARVIGKAGLALGGRDIDRWIAASLCPDQPPSGSLLGACERLKCALSHDSTALVLWRAAEGPPRELRLTRAELEALLVSQGLIAALDQLLESVLAAGRAAGIGPEAIAAVLPVGGSSQLSSVRQWLAERWPQERIHLQRPVEAVALGALALTPGVRVRDVLAEGVSLRCWDQRSSRHRWHPLFLAGQSWPTPTPLDLVLACSHDGQEALELVLGQPLAEQRREVVFEAGVPVLRARPTGEEQVRPWMSQPAPVPLAPPGRQGQDRLRLRFAIDDQGQLVLHCQDLLSREEQPPRLLGRVL